MTVSPSLFSLNNSRKRELRVKTSVKDSINFLMNLWPLSSNLRRKQGNLSPPTANLKMFCIKLKKIMKDWLNNWKEKKLLLLTPIKKLNSWVTKSVISRKKLLKLKKNVKRVRENTKTFAKLLKELQTKTKISPTNLRTLKIQSESAKVNLTSQQSRERTSEKITSSWPTKTNSWTVKLTNVCSTS